MLARFASEDSFDGVSDVTIVRVGANKKYSDGWEAAFGKGKKNASAAAAKSKPSKGKAAKKKSGKKK